MAPTWCVLHVSILARPVSPAREAGVGCLGEQLLQRQPVGRQVEQQVAGDDDVLSADHDLAAGVHVARGVEEDPLDLAADGARTGDGRGGGGPHREDGDARGEDRQGEDGGTLRCPPSCEMSSVWMLPQHVLPFLRRVGGATKNRDAHQQRSGLQPDRVLM